MSRLSIVVVLAAVLLIPMSARANHAPKSFCSESGDVCEEVRKKPDDFRFRLSLGAKYFNRYNLCVTAPDGNRECKRFKVRQMNNGIYGGNVSWVKNYTPAGTGAYTVVWKQNGSRLGDKLGFHVR